MTYKLQGMSGIYPDGFTGALLAGESILDGAVVLHGPTGCRGHHSVMSEHAFPRDDVPERLNFLEPFYFGQPRIPTTYLDGDDFVFGAREKLVTAITEIMKRNPSLLTIVNSPGAALIGDNVIQAVAESKVSIPCAVIEMPALSCSLSEGYQQGLISILHALSLPSGATEARTAALVGLSITHQHWAGSVAELRRLLGLCGIRTLCAIGAGSSIEEYRQVPRAACYAVVHDEYADRIGPWLTEHYGGSLTVSDAGAPLGFAASATWIKAVALALDADPTPALEDIVARRRIVSRLLGQATGSSAALKGMTFAIRADPSIAMPLARWLYEYIGMLPVAVETLNTRETPLAVRLRIWLSGIGCAGAWQMPWYIAKPDLLFADGQQVAAAKGMEGGGVEMTLPARACLDIVPKATLGAIGAAWLIEQILRELWWVLWV
jgi:nitrogenase molybdenum-iron protein alpha/beta subunit